MKKLLILCAAALCFTQAQADVRVNGFANMVASTSTDDFEQFGIDDTIDFSNESLFALQVSADITDKLSATGQIVSRGVDDFDADFEWAYLTYSVSDKFTVSAGRLRLPLFLYSETLDVGYSYHWIVAPKSVYDIAFNNIDGIRANYTDYLGDWEINAQVAGGVIKNPDFGGNALRGDNTLSLSLQLANDVLKFRVVHGRATGTLSSETLSALVPVIGSVDPVLADLLAFEGDTGLFYGASISYDNFDWFVNAEWTLNTNDQTFVPDDEAYYITAGARFGKWTPSLTYESNDQTGDFKFTDRFGMLPPQAQQGLAPAFFGLQLSQFVEYDQLTAGIRYDLDTNIALKADVTKFDNMVDEDNDTTLIRLAVNYIF